MSEKEIVRLLRYAKELPTDLVLYAADCIERLQAHLDERGKYNDWADERIEQLQAELENALEENKRLAEHGGKYMEISEKRYEMFETAVKRAEDAESNLAESQRRERAAVEDLKRIAHKSPRSNCEFCDSTGCIGCSCENNFEWRGPQEVEKGERK